MTRYAQNTTISGAEVGWETDFPPLDDFLWGLARLPRFAGQTLERWSVLDHSWLVYLLAAAEPREVRVACLIHDFAEILTGDIPSPMKPPEFHVRERKLVQRLAAHIGFGMAGDVWPDVWKLVEHYDRQALHAEGAELTGHPWWKPEPAWLDALRRGPGR